MVLQFAEHASAKLYLKAHPGPQYFRKVVRIFYLPMSGLVTEYTKVAGLLDGICYLHSRTPPVIHGDLHDVSFGPWKERMIAESRA